MWLLYVTVSIGGWSGSSLNLTTSADRGVTWTPSQRLTLSPFFNLAELVKNAPVALSGGGWAVPIYHELVSTFPEVLWLDDAAGGIRATKSRMSAGWFGYQPAITPIDHSRALALLRDDGNANAVTVARTEDAGETWSPPQPLNLPNPDAGLDAIRLQDGRLLLAFNDAVNSRENLRLAMSSDQGQTWRRVATLAEEPGADFSYPFLMQTRSGDVQLVYTWKRSGDQACRVQHRLARRALERIGAMNQAAVAELFSAAWPWLAADPVPPACSELVRTDVARVAATLVAWRDCTHRAPVA